MKSRLPRNQLITSMCVGCLALLLAGCAAPIGVDRVPTRQAYAQVDANGLSTGKPSAETMSILYRYQLDHLVPGATDEAVRQLHAKALATGERSLLFALAELSYVAAVDISRSIKPWDRRDPRDYYLGSAIYAWLFLFGEGKDAPPTAFDRRFRDACDFYNYGLGLAFAEKGSTNGEVHFESIRRRLPVGEIELQIDTGRLTVPLGHFEQILLADRFRVHGFSVRNRERGVGTPLICVNPLDAEFNIRSSVPATAFLRGPASLSEITAGVRVCPLEFHPSFDTTSVPIGATSVPLETDLTTYLAYTLKQSTIWKLGPLQFLVPAERIKSQLLLNQPFDPDRIPVVFVHGTFSSPVTWAEMVNTLTADPVLRRRYQAWSFIYGSGNPLVLSIADLRAALTAEIQKRDPAGTNAVLRQMVVIGHSQGGLLTKSTAVETGDRLWREFSTNRLENLTVTDKQRARLQELLFLEPLPFVQRVVFIATPHQGSYLSGSFARRLAQRLVSLPGNLIAHSAEMLKLTEGSEAGRFLEGRMPTSLDGMSPKNPALLVMAKVPVVPSVKAHSIIAIQGDGDPHQGRDGLVTYESAHVDYAVSEYIVRNFHSCLENPATIEEVRRILHQHLEELPATRP